MKKCNMIVFMALLSMLLFSAGCKPDKESDDPSVKPDLFDQSFNNINFYPEPENANYTRIDGSFAKDLVFPGQVVVLGAEATVSAMTQLIESAGGNIEAQVPAAGLYLAVIDAQGLHAFLAAMYQSQLVADAFPNQFIPGNGISAAGNQPALKGDANSIVQVLDASVDMGCSGFYHKDAVGAVAHASGVDVNIIDVTTANHETDSAGADTYKVMEKMLERLNNAKNNNLPAVINVSMGGDDDDVDDKLCFMLRFCYMLEAVEKQNPRLLDNAVIFFSLPNANRNETPLLDKLHQNFPNSPVWDHVYMVGSQEGAQGCGVGYADQGTPSYLAAPACNVQIPGSNCILSGNSFSAPYIAGLVAQTYEMLKAAGKDIELPEVANKLWEYQHSHSGALPSAAELFSLCAGNSGADDKYDGTWSGTFYYTARIPQPSGPPEIVNTSFILTLTLETNISVPGQPQLLNIKAVSCSDPTFGATMAVAPVPPLSMAFLPAAFGSASASGMGIYIEFPNGSLIFTNNTVDGSFTIDQNGNVLASTALVNEFAFGASGTEYYSYLEGSGPGGYAYDWCTFKSWSLVRM